MKKGKKVELLAPAGNYESFLGAVHAGADAIYLGGEKFGARAYADNFTQEELCRCLKIAHLYGRKVYLTVNTLVKEKEMSELYSYLKPFYEAGLDGVIVQDMGVFLYIKEQFPGLSLHVSTQMTITGVHGAEKLKQLGAERIVPARELSLKEISLIKESVDIEIESFIHGAMCYCYSGQCLFSSILGGRSGNRGKCAQPCRLPYKVENRAGKEAYYLSLKDMCTIEMIPELIEAGIDSFKIEGRMKKPEYAAGVTAMYRKYIDLYYENGAGKFAVSKKDMEQLKALYIRSEIQNGYYKRYNGASMVTIGKPSYSKSDEQLLKQIRERFLDSMPRIPVKGKAVLHIGEPALFSVESDGVEVQVKGTVVSLALKQPMQEESVRKQLEKCGATSFVMSALSVDMDENIFISIKELNELRRQALEAVEEQIIEANGLSYEERRQCPVPCEKKETETAVYENDLFFEDGIYTLLQTKEQLQAVVSMLEKKEQLPHFRAVFVSSDLYETEEKKIKRNEEYDLTEKLSQYLKGQVFVAYPYVMRQKDEWINDCFIREKLFAGILVRNVEELSLLQKCGYSGKIITDAGLYIWNKKAESFFLKEAAGCTLPLELNSGEKKSLNEKQAFQIVYGRVPMMITANCIRKTEGRCLNAGKKKEALEEDKTILLIDRMEKEFPVYTNCRHCTNIIYNSIPLSLHKKVNKERGKYRLDFTTESTQETKEILAYFCRIYGGNGEKLNLPYKEYTTGHEKRGAE